MIPPDLKDRLLVTKDYRSFLKTYFEYFSESKHGHRYSFASFSRRAGFSSRSFPGQVLSGKKRLTAHSLPPFIDAMGLTGNWKAYFELLVAIEESDAVARLRTFKSEEKLKLKLVQVRQKISRPEVKKEDASTLFSDYYRWLEIYASLGTPEVGEPIERIVKKTQMPKAPCMDILKKMIDKKLVRQDDQTGNFIATCSFINISGLGDSSAVKKYYLNSLKETYLLAEKSFQSTSRLFINSVFSIESRHASQFKQELRDLINRFSDRAESPEGDRVARILLSFGTI